MMGPEVAVPVSFFVMCTVITATVLRYKERSRGGAISNPQVNEIASRLDRMEQAIDAIAVEVERISEGQRFTTRLLSERGDASPVPARGDVRGDRLGA